MKNVSAGCGGSGRHEVKFSMGDVMFHLASYYKTVFDALLELIQNGCDANASKMSLRIDRDKRSIEYFDNGAGATREEFGVTALHSIGASMKPGDKMGKFGIGLISLTGKCRAWKFITASAFETRNTYNEWTFNSEEIKSQKDSLHIPFTEVKGMRRGDVWWNTSVTAEEYTKDRILGSIDIEALCEAISNRFGIAMRKQNTVVEITVVDRGKSVTDKVVAKQWLGKKIYDKCHHGKRCGNVFFRIYKAAEPQKGLQRFSSTVVFGETGSKEGSRDFRMPGGDAVKNMKNLPKEILEIFTSGAFEGEILVERITLNRERTAFDKDDFLEDLMSVISTWYEQEGELFKKLKNENETARYRTLGMQSILSIRNLIQSNEAIQQVIKRFRFGSAGTGHKILPGRDVLGILEGFGAPGREREEKKPGGGEVVVEEVREEDLDRGEVPPESPEGEEEVPKKVSKHMPVLVERPGGKTTRVVLKDSNLGISLMFDEHINDDILFDFNSKSGLIRLNIRHFLFDKVREKDVNIMRFQEYLIMKILVRASLYEDHMIGATEDRLLLEDCKAFVALLIGSDSFMKRMPLVSRPMSK